MFFQMIKQYTWSFYLRVPCHVHFLHLLHFFFVLENWLCNVYSYIKAIFIFKCIKQTLIFNIKIIVVNFSMCQTKTKKMCNFFIMVCDCFSILNKLNKTFQVDLQVIFHLKNILTHIKYICVILANKMIFLHKS